jgi:hypothetical protein
MAKALLGAVGGPDPRLIAEVRRLRERQRQLEDEVVRLRDENDALIASMSDPAPLLSQLDEAALT